MTTILNRKLEAVLQQLAPRTSSSSSSSSLKRRSSSLLPSPEAFVGGQKKPKTIATLPEEHSPYTQALNVLGTGNYAQAKTIAKTALSDPSLSNEDRGKLNDLLQTIKTHKVAPTPAIGVKTRTSTPFEKFSE